MFIELIDALRCPSEHGPIALVATIIRRDGRQIVDGLLGCPMCRREFPIRDGIAWFRPPDAVSTTPAWNSPPQEEGAIRIGAFLGASEGIMVALVGEWARYAAELAELAGLRVFAVNPRGPVEESERVGVLYSDNQLPFRGYSLRGIAIGAPAWSPQEMDLATRTLAYSGRMVAPASAPLPRAVEEIARDDSVWIAEKRAALVGLHRR
jgi:uncharacterized protein YbaR (Trm112 family)